MLWSYLKSNVVALFSINSMMAIAQSYSAFTTEVLIPFYPEPRNEPPNAPFTEKIRINVRIVRDGLSKIYHPSIDTGTCGYVVSKDGFPGSVPDDAPIGWEYLSSSKILYSGHWVMSDVYYTDAAVEVKARFPILVIDDRTVCRDYDPAIHTNICLNPESTIHNPTDIALFGTGFGRQENGQPQGDPDKNPFLNVVSIDGVPTSTNPAFRNGYIISKAGISIGLTSTNTVGISFTDLLPGAHHSTYPLDWAPVPACIRVTDMPACVAGTALIDTGISHSYLTLPYRSPVHTHNATSPSSGDRVKVLDDDSFVQLGIGSSSPYVVNDDFYVGSSSGIAIGPVPVMVITTLTNQKPPYMNTGRFFLRTWNVAYDAVGGRLGFRQVWS